MVFALPVSADTTPELTSEEKSSLQLMREEEKLAYDVYSHLYVIYKDRPFANISSAEEKHTNTVLWLMEKYGVEDKGSSLQGKFNNSKLQALYDKLIELGESSREMAFAVGVIVEETDIADLDDSLKNTNNPDLIRVFKNLRAGSYRHLNAFQSWLDSLSENPEATHEKVMEAIRKT